MLNQPVFFLLNQTDDVISVFRWTEDLYWLEYRDHEEDEDPLDYEIGTISKSKLEKKIKDGEYILYNEELL